MLAVPNIRDEEEVLGRAPFHPLAMSPQTRLGGRKVPTALETVCVNTGGSSPFQPKLTDQGVDGNARSPLHSAWKRHMWFDRL